jgi:hypothetical protein
MSTSTVPKGAPEPISFCLLVSGQGRVRQHYLAGMVILKVLGVAVDHAAADVELLQIDGGEVVARNAVVKLLRNAGDLLVGVDHTL